MLPAAAVQPRNFIRIWPDWSTQGAKSKIFLQYRRGVASCEAGARPGTAG
jgi:hypothetical protein